MIVDPLPSAPSDAPSVEHRLVGFEPDNLLAFLALLGVMRGLDAVRPDWRARFYWDVQHLPARPIVSTGNAIMPLEIASAAALACEYFEPDYDFGEAKLHRLRRGEVRAFMANARAAGPERSGRTALLCALASDSAVREEGTIVPTPLCLLFGQGHQFFLKRLSQALRFGLSATGAKRKRSAVRTSAETMQRALFEPWRRTDQVPTFRWDPDEDRRYALRANEPAVDPILTVAGAQALAALGLAVLTAVPITERGEVRLQAVATRTSRNGVEVTWPIWTEPLSLAALRPLLSHPILAEHTPDHASLKAYRVYELRRARRISVGKYMNFTRAVQL